MLKINLISEIGNNLYQYAGCRSIAQNLGYNFLVDCSGQGLNYHFGGDGVHRPILDYFHFDLGVNDGEVKYSFYEGGNALLTDQNTIKDFTQLNAFFCCPLYFENYNDDLQKWFKFKIEDYSILEKYNIDDYCFIHFRGGDFYQHFKDKEQFLTEIYYKDAVKQIPVKKFVILTNDIKLAIQYFQWMKDESLEFVILQNSSKLDFFTLTRAKFYIGSYSTFSEWAGYLNINIKNNIMIFPHNVREHVETFYPFKYFTYLK